MTTERGFTLLEVLVALMLFSIVMAGMAPAFLSQIQHNHQSEIQTEAMVAAEQVIDAYRFQDPTSLPSSGSPGDQNIAVNGRTYKVTPTFCLTSSFCSTTMRHISVVVKLNNVQKFQTETVFTQLK